jgi:tyrosine ammonia-lyase
MLIGPDSPLTLPALARIAAVPEAIHFSAASRERVASAAAFLERLVAERRVVYGITTGFGPLAGTWIDPSRSEELQTYLLAHLRSGVGPPLPREAVRAMMVARLASLSRGHSGIRMETLELLAAMVERDVTPVVPSMGTVGASGDLTPLAHMAATLQGEGEVLVEGVVRPAGEGLRRVGLEPIVFGPKEAIALVNGTSTMTAIAALNGEAAERQLHLAVALGLLYAEIFGARSEAFDHRVGDLRPHPGQLKVHDLIAARTADGSRLDRSSSTTGALPRAGSGSGGTPDGAAGVVPGAAVEAPQTVGGGGPGDGGGPGNGVIGNQRIVQDPYSMRCIPQLYGAAFDTLAFHNATVERELNAVTDNPLLFPEDDTVIQAGNFFGQHVAAVSDALTAALVTVAGHIERTIDRVTDPVRSEGLPAMLQPREPGLQSGLMGAQVTATAILAEMRTRTVPAGTQSIATNAANQDVVTMGTIAARTAAWQVERLWDLLAIQAIAMAQAMELREKAESGEAAAKNDGRAVAHPGTHPGARSANGGDEAQRDGVARSDFSSASRRLVAAVRTIVPTLENDRALSGDIARLAGAMRSGAVDPGR